MGQVVPQQHLWRERAEAAEAEMTGFAAAGATGGGAGGDGGGVNGGIAAAAATGEGAGEGCGCKCRRRLGAVASAARGRAQRGSRSSRTGGGDSSRSAMFYLKGLRAAFCRSQRWPMGKRQGHVDELVAYGPPPRGSSPPCVPDTSPAWRPPAARGAAPMQQHAQGKASDTPVGCPRNISMVPYRPRRLGIRTRT